MLSLLAAAALAAPSGQYLLWMSTEQGDSMRLAVELTPMPPCRKSAAALISDGDTSHFALAGYSDTSISIDFTAGEHFFGGWVELDGQSDDNYLGEFMDESFVFWKARLQRTSDVTSLHAQPLTVTFNAPPRIIRDELYVRDPAQNQGPAAFVAHPTVPDNYLVCYGYDTSRYGSLVHAVAYPDERTDNWAPIPMANLAGDVRDVTTDATVRLESGRLFMTLRNDALGTSVDLIRGAFTP